MGTTSIVGANLKFGDRLNIGRRTCVGCAADGYVLDGCLGHLMLFNKTLTSNETMLWSSLMADDML